MEEIIPGDTVILDKEFNNSSKVKVVAISSNELFARVHDASLEDPTDKDCWDVMMNRLSKIK